MTQVVTTNNEITENNYVKLAPMLERLNNINLAILKGRLERGMYLARYTTLFVSYKIYIV